MGNAPARWLSILRVAAPVIVLTLTGACNPGPRVISNSGGAGNSAGTGGGAGMSGGGAGMDAAAGGSRDAGQLPDVGQVNLGARPAWEAVAPGEHPRLFFRKYDLPRLRTMAATAEGTAWLTKLKASLGGGDALRTDLKSFTMMDAFGFGFLYQLTGEQKYADICKQAVDLYLGGTPNKNPKYNWAAPSGYMDYVGPSFSSVAMAYDVCYDGWDPAYRAMIAQKLMSYSCPNAKIEGWPTQGDKVTLEQMAVTPPGDPGVWTFGPTVGGAGLTVLATMGDPGVDAATTTRLLAGVKTNIDRVFAEGWGEMGGFFRMAQQGEIMANEGFVPLLQAMRVATNRDYVAEQPGASWITMHWVFDLMKDPDPKVPLPRYPDRHDAPSMATTFGFRAGLYDEGAFMQGAGVVRAEHLPALLWTFQTLKPEGTYIDYPQHAVLGFINMPAGIAPKNPGEVIPHVLRDKLNGLYEFRKGWKDENDILVTALLGGYSDEQPNTSVTVWGFGFRTTFGSFPGGDGLTRPRATPETFATSPDGSSVLSIAGTSLAIDFSGRSGAEALLAFVGPRDDLKVDNMRHQDFGARAATTQVMLGTTTVYVMTLQSGAAPKVATAGNTIGVGGQTISWNGSSLVLSSLAP